MSRDDFLIRRRSGRVLVGAAALYLLMFVGYPVVYSLIMSVQKVTRANLRFSSIGRLSG